MTTIKVPGKLFLAGEFAATYSGQASIVLAVNRFMRFTIQPHDNYQITSDQLGIYPGLLFEKENNPLNDDAWQIVTQACRTIAAYLPATKIKHTQPFQLQITSGLELDGQKIGLGSSGATAVGVCQALLMYYQIPFTKYELFKLATLTLFQLPHFQKGSMGDVAAAVFGGIVYYEKFDTNWLTHQLSTTPLSNIVQNNWPQLQLKNLHQPKTWELLVAWTQSPADTQNSLQRLPVDPTTFLSASQTTVKQVATALENESWTAFQQALAQNQSEIITYTKAANINYQTSQLDHFLQLIQTFAIPGKISGAGNGDNALAWTKLQDTTKRHAFIQACIKADLRPLPLTIYHE
ncbi:phosphomevalonate kinase [Weissella kandleri]|uniref:phosphomevalonate kinase n=1 Tax=Weissella kandleri TaxID=1616 RepID=UPI00387EDF18